MNNDQAGGDLLIVAGLGESIAELDSQEAALVEAGVAIAPAHHSYAVTDNQQQALEKQRRDSLLGSILHAQHKHLGSAAAALPAPAAQGLLNGVDAAAAAAAVANKRCERQGECETPKAAPDCGLASADHDHQSGSEDEGHKTKRPPGTQQCPRCNSKNTKFCYYNNYNVKQPRYYCRDCQRYWTMGGTLRQIAPGAGRRKSKSSAPAKAKTSDHDAEAAAAPPTPSEAEVALYPPSTTAAAAAALQQTRVVSPVLDPAIDFSVPKGVLPSSALATQSQTQAAVAAAGGPGLAHQGSLSQPLQAHHCSSILAASDATAAAGTASTLMQQTHQTTQQQLSQSPDAMLAQLKQLLDPAGFGAAAAPATGLGRLNPLLAASLAPGLSCQLPEHAGGGGLPGLLGSPMGFQTAAVAAAVAAASGVDPVMSLGAILTAISAAGQQQALGQQSQYGAAMGALTAAGLLPKGLDLTAAAAAAVQGGPAAAAAAALGLFRPQQQQLASAHQQQLAALASLQGLLPGLPALLGYQQQQQAVEQQLQQYQQQVQQLQLQQLQHALQGGPQVSAASHQYQQQLQLMAQLAGISDWPMANNGVPEQAAADITKTDAPPPKADACPAAASKPAAAAAETTALAAQLYEAAAQQLQQVLPDTLTGELGYADGPAGHVSAVEACSAADVDGSDAAGRRIRQRCQATIAGGGDVASPGQQMQVPGQQMQVPGQQMQVPGQQVLVPGQQMQAPGQQMLVPGQQMQVPGQHVPQQAAAPCNSVVTSMGPPAAVKLQRQQVQGTMGPPPPQKPPVQHKTQQSQAAMHPSQPLQQQQQADDQCIAQQVQQQGLLQQLQQLQAVYGGSSSGNPFAAFSQQPQQLQQPWLSTAALAAAAGLAAGGGAGAGLDSSLLMAFGQGLLPTATGSLQGQNGAAHNQQQQQQQVQPSAVMGQQGVSQQDVAGQLAAAMQAQAGAMQMANSFAAAANMGQGSLAQAVPPLQVAAAAAGAAGVLGLPNMGGANLDWAQGLWGGPTGQQQQQPANAQVQPQSAQAKPDPAAVCAVGASGWVPQQNMNPGNTTAMAAANYMAQQLAAAAGFPGMRC